jgi:hypothetical protein
MNDARARFALSASWLVLSCAILRFISSFESHVAFQLDARGLVIGCQHHDSRHTCNGPANQKCAQTAAGNGRPGHKPGGTCDLA